MTKTDYFEARVLNYVTRALNLGSISTYIGLLTVAPTDSSAGTETAYSGYTRMALSTSNFASAATVGTIVNTAAITYPTNGGATQNFVAVAIYDASTSGNMLYWYALPVTLTVNSGETPRFSIGALVLNED